MSTFIGVNNNLAYCFQEVLTAVLRVRFQRQQVQDAGSFRTHMRQLLQQAMSEARGLGYSGQNIQMAVLVTVGYLDESVLNLQSSALAEWARRPLQEELFGGHVAGETVFRNLANLLQEQDSSEVADVLELHSLCLQLGYKGRYAFGGGGELRQLIQLCREKIRRIRGNASLFRAPGVVAVLPANSSTDGLGRGLLITSIALAVLTVAAFTGYEFSLSAGASRLGTASAVVR